MLSINTKWRIVAGVAAFGILLAIGVGVYMKGRSDGVALVEARVAKEKQEWERRVADAQIEHQKEVAEIHSAYGNVVGRFRNEIAKLTDNPQVVERYINRYIPIETECAIPQGFVELHNQAAAGQSLNDRPVDSGRITDKTLADVGGTVAENYYTCNEIAARLEALQQIVKQYQKQQQELIR